MKTQIKKTIKRRYVSPHTELIPMLNEHKILAGSPPLKSGSEVIPSTEDPNNTDPEWE